MSEKVGRAMHDAKEGDVVVIEVEDPVTYEQMVEWLQAWAAKLGAQLRLSGEIGFGRECVGITREDMYPEYTWYDAATQSWPNGDVWSPEDAYHKGEYVAVLGRGEDAVRELYEWGRWFDARGFTLEVSDAVPQPGLHPMFAKALGQDKHVRMVRPAEPPEGTVGSIRHVLETAPMGDSALRDAIEALLDQVEKFESRLATAEARIGQLAAALDLMEVHG